MTHFNAASRLHRLFADALQDARANPQVPASDTWARRFGLVLPDDAPKLLRRGADMMDMTRQIRDRLEVDGGAGATVALRYFHEIEQACVRWPHVGAISQHEFMSQTSDTGVYSLEMCAIELARIDDEREVDAERLSYLLGEVRRLIDEVSELRPPEDWAWLLDRLCDVESALTAYNLTGMTGIRAAADRMLGGMVTRRQTIADPPESRFYDRLNVLLSGLMLVAQLAVMPAALEAPEPSQVIVNVDNHTVIELTVEPHSETENHEPETVIIDEASAEQP